MQNQNRASSRPKINVKRMTHYAPIVWFVVMLLGLPIAGALFALTGLTVYSGLWGLIVLVATGLVLYPLVIISLGRTPSYPNNVQSENNRQSAGARTEQPIFFFNLPLCDPSEFYGRNAARLTLITRIANGGSSSIVGERRAGKTWLLQYLQLVASTHSQFGPFYRVGLVSATDTRSKSLSDFVQWALRELNVPRPSHDSGLQPLRQLSQGMRALKKQGIIPVLCIDEFEGFRNKQEFNNAFFEGLRAMAQDDSLVLVTASRSPLKEVIGAVSGQTSPLFNIVQQISLHPFTEREARDFVSQKSNMARFTKKESDFFFNQSVLPNTRGEPYWPPFLLQLVGQMLLDDKQTAHGQSLDDKLDTFHYQREFKQRLNEAYQAVMEHTISNIDNPYKPGQVLGLNDSLFVGRHHLTAQLDYVLKQESRRSALLLQGERRMGKTCTLYQLPKLLGASYIPVVHNLQDPKLYARISALLGTIANGVYDELSQRGIRIKDIPTERLVEARDDPNAYYIFDGWLKEVQSVLEEKERLLLLAFDEFEKLDEVGEKGYLDLSLFLDWCRQVIQYRPNIILLFSGVRTFRSMGEKTGLNWSHYFVNVQTFKVSFLKSEEARHLILHPRPDYPGEEIFGAVVEQIIQETNCHPFLVQALCSQLVDTLNVEKREKVESAGVERAVKQVVESWDGYFDDLWKRSDELQRACLLALDAQERDEGMTLSDIQQHSQLDEKSIRQVLRILVSRDLVIDNDDGTYRIAAPIFRRWVKYNS